MVVVDPSLAVTTERLLIRPLSIDDAAAVNIMRSDPEVMKHTSMPPCDDMEKTKAWIQGCHDRDNCWNFCMELLPTTIQSNSTSPRVIGMIGAVRAPEVGYMINSDFWGKGYATEALRAWLPLFFSRCPRPGGESERFEYAEALADTENIPSQNVLVKAGFKLVERREKDFESPVLGLRDTLFYRKYRNETP